MQHETSRDTTDHLTRVRVIQQAETDDEIVRSADPEADAEVIRQGTSGCVNHLCGCR